MKKQRTSLFRILILSLVMLVTAFIIAIAWFSSLTEATASGLSVKASPGSGLEATFTPSVEDSWDFNISDNTPKSYPLVTGSGLFSGGKIDLFLPTVNKATGEVEKNSDGFWGVRSDAVAGKDFFETDVYFRSTEQLDVAITSESTVTPRSLVTDSNGNNLFDSNLSDFGNFSRDYIAGASRIGVYDADNNLKFVWAPNKNYELKAGNEFVEIKKNSAAGGGSLDTNPEVTFGINNWAYAPEGSSNYYYMWEAQTPPDNNYPTTFTNKDNPQGITMRYKDGKYYAAFDVSSTTYVDHGIFAQPVSRKYNDGSTSGTKVTDKPDLPSTQSYSDTGNYKQTEEKFLSNYEVGGVTYKYIGLYFEGAKNLNFTANSVAWAKLSISAGTQNTKFFSTMDRFQVLIECDPNNNGHLKVIDFAFYSTSGGGIGGGTIGTGQAGSSAFALKDNQQIVIASPNDDPENKSTYALNASSSSITSNEILLNATTVTEEDADNNNITRDTYKINRDSLLPGSVFTVETTGGVGQYKFKHDETGLYLYDNNGTLGLTDSAYATPFELTNGSDYTVTVTNGEGVTEQKTLTFCRLQSKGSSGYYLSINESGAFLSSHTLDCRIFISQGDSSLSSSYTFSDNRETTEQYRYLKSNTSKIINLSELDKKVSAFPVDPQTKIITDLSNIADVSIVRLTKEKDTDQYYTGKIKIRIWVEGTDNEAKTPLVNGIFYTQLVFNGTRVSA